MRVIPCSEEPPLYQVDLSLPPQSRYSQICNDYKEEIAKLIPIYDNILSYTPFPGFFSFIAKSLLKKVFSKEETEEIKGIAKDTGVPLHLVVAYNTFLDLFSGCISGGVMAKVPRARESRMLHFRNLDWDMEPLRDMIIRVEYLVSGKVIARAVTYAGYVGVLTGVRRVECVSALEIRSESSTTRNRFHHFLVLVGRQPSIASELRQILLSPGRPPTFTQLTNRFSESKLSSCYITFCTPSSVLVIEKDLSSTTIHTSDTFLAVTNHDQEMESWSPSEWHDLVKEKRVPDIAGAREIVDESMERKACMCSLYREWVEDGQETTLRDIKRWLRIYPIRNECTHFSCIMDPSMPGGGLRWVEACEVER
ncbi:hypothetical protein CVT26_006261 [Gymnopilus dilepis]|uniref:ceramidase n=1 Tax=Gymnopilus dilepis TaxID=231916 RepID=A0A409Y191_9AGAR|nr:hypothetical protein CVT26_006261 [Gymnopilus dilepis]